MGSTDLKHETAVETVKAAPAVAGAVYSTLTLNEWVALATLVYIVLQAGVLLHKHYWRIQDRKREKDDELKN